MDPAVQNPSAESTQQPHESYYEKRNWKKWLGIYAIIAILIYGAIYYYVFYSKQNPYLPEKIYTTPTLTPTTTMNISSAVIKLAQEDLAKKINVNISDITVLSQEEHSWPNASLGCPQEGMMYAQVITPGYSVAFSYGKNVYQYHTDKNRSFALCTLISQPGDHCGGFIANANQCTPGYYCKSEPKNADTGGTCIKE